MFSPGSGYTLDEIAVLPGHVLLSQACQKPQPPLLEIVRDDRQITHLICVRLKHLLYDLWGGALGLLPVVSLI